MSLFIIDFLTTVLIGKLEALLCDKFEAISYYSILSLLKITFAKKVLVLQNTSHTLSANPLNVTIRL
jgi:hypothetical protein